MIKVPLTVPLHCVSLKANPLLRFDLKQVRLASVDTDRLTITVMVEQKEPVQITFKSRAVLNKAYHEWSKANYSAKPGTIIKVNFKRESAKYSVP